MMLTTKQLIIAYEQLIITCKKLEKRNMSPSAHSKEARWDIAAEIASNNIKGGLHQRWLT
jgi:hypothetical protein